MPKVGLEPMNPGSTAAPRAASRPDTLLGPLYLSSGSVLYFIPLFAKIFWKPVCIPTPQCLTIHSIL